MAIEWDEEIQWDDEEPRLKQERRGGLDEAVRFAGNTIRSAGQGAIPFYDEITAGIRSVADPSLYGDDRSLGERYDLARDQETGGLAYHRDTYPIAAYGTEIGAGFVSPLNKLGPVTKGGQGVIQGGKNLFQNVTRNAAEAGIFGAGEGDTLDQRLDNAYRAMVFGGGLTAGLDVAGRTAGTVLDAAKLPVPLRDPSTGEFIPMHIANPNSMRAGVQRTALGRISGANELLQEQQAPYLARGREGLNRAVAAQTDELGRVDTHYRHVRSDIDNMANQAVKQANEEAAERAARVQAEGNQQVVNSQRQADATGTEAAAKVDADRLKFRLDRRKTSLPANASDELVEMASDPNVDERIFNMRLNKEWVDKGFREVKDTTFAANDKFLDDLETVFKDDAALRNAVKDPLKESAVVRQKLESLNIDPEDIEGMEPAEIYRLVLSGDTSGDVLMELRNMFARNTGDQTLRSPANRKVANIFDQFIVSQLEEVDPKLADQFLAQLPAWGSKVNYSGAVSKANTPAQGRYGQFHEDDWLAATPRPRRDTLTGSYQVEAENIKSSKPPAGSNKADIKEIEANIKAQQDKIKADTKAKVAEAKATAKEEGKSVALAKSTAKDEVKARTGEAIDEAKEVNAALDKAAVKGGPSPYMASLFGAMLPWTRGPASAYAAGTSAGRSLASEGAQEFVAGQGRKTRAIADALREGRTEYVTRGAARNVGRGVAQEDEERDRFYIYR